MLRVDRYAFDERERRLVHHHARDAAPSVVPQYYDIWTRLGMLIVVTDLERNEPIALTSGLGVLSIHACEHGPYQPDVTHFALDHDARHEEEAIATFTEGLRSAFVVNDTSEPRIDLGDGPASARLARYAIAHTIGQLISLRNGLDTPFARTHLPTINALARDWHHALPRSTATTLMRACSHLTVTSA